MIRGFPDATGRLGRDPRLPFAGLEELLHLLGAAGLLADDEGRDPAGLLRAVCERLAALTGSGSA